ncbi:MAG: HAD-IA family hydrolase [Anaerolineae bacterium]|nr:HAD-IA family hydrolase [Anaerolineae bacterium]
MTYNTILFDFDGTLTPSLDLWVEAYHFALTACDVHLTPQMIVQQCFYRPYAEVAADLGIPPERDFRQLMESGLEQAFANAKLYPMARELLDGCKQAGYTVGLVTSSAASLMAHALPKLGLVDCFDTVVCGSDVKNHKPHPEPVQLALARLGKSAANALFVGDTWMDMHAGRAAGTRTALYMPEDAAAFNNVDKLHASQPDFIFADHRELIRYLLPTHMI